MALQKGLTTVSDSGGGILLSLIVKYCAFPQFQSHPPMLSKSRYEESKKPLANVQAKLSLPNLHSPPFPTFLQSTFPSLHYTLKIFLAHNHMRMHTGNVYVVKI